MSASRSPYSQLQPEDRLTIASLLQQRYSVRGIARVLGRCASTISREIARNSVSGQGYAHTRSAAQRTKKALRKTPAQAASAKPSMAIGRSFLALSLVT